MTATNSPEELPPVWFDAGITLEQIRTCFEEAKAEIRIASGFFTLRGWGMIRRFTKDKKVYLLVGIDEPADDRAKMALVNDIIRDLATGWDRDRRKSVQDLIEKIEARGFHIVDARARDHHAKLYLVDCTIAITTSANITGRGLTGQIEAGHINRIQKEVTLLVEKFDAHFAEAIDITQALLDALKRWLDLVSPWDIYLKTMLLLEDLKPLKAKYTKNPHSYQVDMIAQSLQQIRTYNGSMLVASTGLGKTIVAVHIALHLKEEDEIQNVMVVAPKPVQPSWKKEFRDAGIPCDFFVHQAFDAKSSEKDGSLNTYEEILEGIDNKDWLIIIDESHNFRNRYKQDLFNLKNNPKERLAFKRLRALCKKGKTKVLLLTGSPYAKEENNLNSQLYLLPHTAESRNVLFPEFFDDANAWRLEKTSDFITLPVVSQLTTPHVAKYYGETDEHGIYIAHEKLRNYIPNITLHSIYFPLPCEIAMTEMIAGQYLYLNRDTNAMIRKSIVGLAKIAWTSSPLALRCLLERVLDTPGGVNKYPKAIFSASLEERERIILPIVAALKQKSFKQDEKLWALLKYILTPNLREGKKVIIFCERVATVLFLEQGIGELMPEARVVATIDEYTKDNYKMKETKEIEKAIAKFAPRANNAEGKFKDTFDIFISTDAYGVGVNMQDAEVVVNYDIDWTPINPIQRAGRILRFDNHPRDVSLYTFIPQLPQEATISLELDMGRRWQTLVSRHDEARKLIDLPVLTLSTSQEINLPEMASSVTIRAGKLSMEDFGDVDISPYYQHTANLQLHRTDANILRSDITSAKLYNGDRPKLYVLLKVDSKYHPILYEPAKETCEEVSNIVELLNLIQAEHDTPTAMVDPNEIEVLSDKCIRLWCTEKGILETDVIRECTLYLKPEGKPDDIKEWLA
jgi:superfamily II DNA or RNA helicase